MKSIAVLVHFWNSIKEMKTKWTQREAQKWKQNKTKKVKRKKVNKTKNKRWTKSRQATKEIERNWKKSKKKRKENERKEKEQIRVRQVSEFSLTMCPMLQSPNSLWSESGVDKGRTNGSDCSIEVDEEVCIGLLERFVDKLDEKESIWFDCEVLAKQVDSESMLELLSSFT